MRQRILLLLFSVLFLSLNAQHTLSPKAEISVLTVGPGNSLNDAFGHSAFRIKDGINGLDIVYGFGQYDFNTPNFYLKFAQGRLKYQISKSTFKRFHHIYQYLNRSIKEQVLDLSQSEKQQLHNYLINNYKPENRDYLYEFFFDNCATRIKDVVNITTNNNIKFNLPEDYTQKTFRRLIYDNVTKNTWGSFGIDIALGSVIDRKATAVEQMFLPNNIYRFFEVAKHKITGKPLVKHTQAVYKKKVTKANISFFTSPLFILSVIALIILFITYKDFKNNKRSKWIDVLLFMLTGIVGIFILLLWFATDHTGTHQNYNLLWAFVLNVLMIGQILKNKVNAWFIKYLKFLLIMLCLLTLHWIIGVQVFAIGLIPLLVVLFARYLFLIKHFSGRLKVVSSISSKQ